MQKILILSIIFLMQTSAIFSSEDTDALRAHHGVELQVKNYPKHFENIALKKNEQVAVLMPTFNRPHYLKKTLKAIEQNPESQKFSFFFFLDGGPLAKQDENADIISKSSIAHKMLLYRKGNCGLGVNLIDARRFLFDWCKYDKVIVIEDDTIISPHYFTFLLNLYNWSQTQHDNIGMVSGYTHCFLNREEKQKKLHEVTKSYVAPYGYCIGKKHWDIIKDTLYFYEKHFLNVPYKKRDVPAIRAWMKDQVKHRDTSAFNFKKIFDIETQEKERFAREKLSTTQDMVTYMGLYLRGYQLVTSVVNRTTHIGKYGTNFNPNAYNMVQGRVKLDIFNEDQFITTFTKKGNV